MKQNCLDCKKCGLTSVFKGIWDLNEETELPSDKSNSWEEYLTLRFLSVHKKEVDRKWCT